MQKDDETLRQEKEKLDSLTLKSDELQHNSFEISEEVIEIREPIKRKKVEKTSSQFTFYSEDPEKLESFQVDASLVLLSFAEQLKLDSRNYSVGQSIIDAKSLTSPDKTRTNGRRYLPFDINWSFSSNVLVITSASNTLNFIEEEIGNDIEKVKEHIKDRSK